MAKVKINDTEIEVPNGTNMIEAAKLAGEEIPHYCYHPHLSIAGNCRMCLVETTTPRGPVLEIACNMQARDGLAIRTDTAQVLHMRKSVMEFLLVNHPLDCPICDQSGECRLQDYYMEHGQYDSRGLDPKVGKNKRQDIGDLIVLDAERCVQCSRCERFGDEVTGTGELRLMNRGDHTEIGMFPGDRLSHNYQGNLADICPVGALTNKDFRFQRRVWYLKETASVCTGCATGCNIQVCHQEGEVFRYLPRRNDQVNKSWMCDMGRLSYQEIAGLKRILKASVDGKAVEPDVATGEIATRIRAAGAAGVGFVLGTRATNEANWALLQMVRANVPGARIFVVEGNDGGQAAQGDTLLLSGDRNPNTAGARLLARHDGNVGDRLALLAALPELKLLVVLEDDVLGRLGAALPPVVFFGAFKNATAQAAAIVVPTAHPVEQDGSYINRQDRVQRVRRAVNPVGESAPAYVVVDRLGARLGKAPGTQMVAAAFNGMARAVERMRGLEFKGLGAEGRLLAPEAVTAVPGAEAST
ncbi:MAG: 2Fe-2S iron-sulfur cluster-binding protein [Pseudomonadota bacterium]|nr:2Fe-2S iron-sulfur cluster-binding protein [Pseudomonadota bacterium]